MTAKLVLGALIAVILFAASAPLAIAGPPKTKAECDAAGWKWNETTQTCSQ
jgi:hypothetical protein